MSNLSRRPMPSIPSYHTLAMNNLAKWRGTATHMLPGYHPMHRRRGAATAARGGDRYAPWNLSYSWSAAIQMPLFQVASYTRPEHASYPTPPTSHCLPYYYLTSHVYVSPLPAVQRRVPRAPRGHQPAPQGHGHAVRRQPQGRLRSGPWKDVGRVLNLTPLHKPLPGMFLVCARICLGVHYGSLPFVCVRVRSCASNEIETRNKLRGANWVWCGDVRHGGTLGTTPQVHPLAPRTFFCVKPYRYLPASQIGLTSLSLRFPPALQLSVFHESLASHQDQLSSH
eukprot:scaffold37942_cov57-Phaeocystis_antarctica.AAC.2